MVDSQSLVSVPDGLPGLVTVVSDETWDRESVKDDAVTDDAVRLCARFGAAGRGKLSYETYLGGWRSASRTSFRVPSMVWAARVRSRSG